VAPRRSISLRWWRRWVAQKNDEIRNPNSKAHYRHLREQARVLASIFVLLSCFVIRHSSFVIHPLMRSAARAIFLQLVVVVGVIALLGWAAHHFPVLETITRAQQRIGAMKWWGAVLYPLLLAACNLLLLPGGVLSIGSGVLFGLWWGFFLVWAGTVLGAALAFLLSRKFGRRWVEKRSLRDERWVALDAAVEREGWKIILLTQIHPLFPTSLLSYIYGITRIRFWPCMFWIAVGQAPGLFCYAYLGTLAQYGIRLARGQTHPQPVEYVVWIGGLVLTITATTLLARLAVRLLKEAGLTVGTAKSGKKPEN
jgi:uncharacterized membrane protein YdjX (TVP38/TMEM64 family)